MRLTNVKGELRIASETISFIANLTLKRQGKNFYVSLVFEDFDMRLDAWLDNVSNRPGKLIGYGNSGTIIIKTKKQTLYIRKCLPTNRKLRGFSGQQKPLPGTLLLFAQSIGFISKCNLKNSIKYKVTWLNTFDWPEATTTDGGGFLYNKLTIKNLESVFTAHKTNRDGMADIELQTKGSRGFTKIKLNNALWLWSFVLNKRIEISSIEYIRNHKRFRIYRVPETASERASILPIKSGQVRENKMLMVTLFDTLQNSYWKQEKHLISPMIIDYYLQAQRTFLWAGNIMLFNLLEYFNYKLKQSPHTVIEKDDFDKIVPELESLLEKELSSINADKIKKKLLLNKLKSLNHISFTESVERWLNHNSVYLSDKEMKEINERNPFVHAYGLNSKRYKGFPHSYQEVHENHQTMVVIIGKIILRLLNYDKAYVDTATEGFPMFNIINGIKVGYHIAWNF